MKDRLDGMRVFAQVVEAKSFSAAAEKLGMSKSLASRQVSAPERSLSVKLMHRSTRKLAVNRSLPCASPAYLKRHGLPRRIEDLRKHECVLFPVLAPKGVWTLRRDGRKYSVPVTGAFETDEMDAVCAAVVAGLGIGILPIYMAGDALQAGSTRTAVAAVSGCAGERHLPGLLTQPHARIARARALIDFLVERFGAAPSREAGW